MLFSMKIRIFLCKDKLGLSFLIRVVPLMLQSGTAFLFVISIEVSPLSKKYK